MLSQRHALGLLFLVLALGFGLIALAAGRAGVWVVALAAAALGGWMGTMSLRLPEQESALTRRILSPWRRSRTRARSGTSTARPATGRSATA